MTTMTAPADRPIRLGVAGLGRAFTLMLPTLMADPRLQLVAGADGRAEAREVWHFQTELFPSLSDARGRVVSVRSLRRVR